MRLIDADVTYKMAKDDKRYSAFHYRKADLGDLYYLVLVDSPTIEAEPVRHGEWVHDKEYRYPPYCSCCNAIAPKDCTGEDFYDSNRCPNCGAKMRGKTE